MMLIKKLGWEDQSRLISLCHLLSISDQALLWDGKCIDKVSSNCDLTKLSIHKDESNDDFLLELHICFLSFNNCPFKSVGIAGCNERYHVNYRIIEALKSFPIHKVSLDESRISAAVTVLEVILEDFSSEKPEVKKIMLYEMLRLSSRLGSISPIKMGVLKAFQQRCEIEDFIFDDLLERAQIFHAEQAKTEAIIYE